MSGNLRLRLQRYKQSGELGGAPGGPADPFRTDPLFPGEGTELDTPAGRCYVRELYLPLNYLHGPGPLSELLVLNGPGWELPAKDKRLQEVNPAGSLFVDIETTGLAGGSGTWAFLIGTGWFELTCFRLRQYFLRRLPEEKAMIHHFTQAASNYPSLVTFNGKAFDLPIIWNRQILTRAPGLTKPLYHVDLLHCARRLYKQRLSSCNLRSLEESLLCFQRQGDIPGEEIPAVYFNYLRRGETARLIEVFKHNALDILSMVSLLCRILKTVSEQQIDHPADYLALGNLYLETGQVDKATCCYKYATSGSSGALAGKARWQLSLIYKKQRRWKEAVAQWEQLINCRPDFINPYLELAKFYEHRQIDLPAALKLTRTALALAYRQGHCRLTGPQGVPALHHRRRRLERKLGLQPPEAPAL